MSNPDFETFDDNTPEAATDCALSQSAIKRAAEALRREVRPRVKVETTQASILLTFKGQTPKVPNPYMGFPVVFIRLRRRRLTR